ncbi:MAG: hypothetical protein ACRD0W_14660 [Acidimicrobiales bacterium]
MNKIVSVALRVGVLLLMAGLSFWVGEARATAGPSLAVVAGACMLDEARLAARRRLRAAMAERHRQRRLERGGRWGGLWGSNP